MFFHIENSEVSSRTPTDCKVDRISALLKAYSNSSNNQYFDILPANVSPKKKKFKPLSLSFDRLPVYHIPVLLICFLSFYFFLTFTELRMTFKEAIQRGLTMLERNSKTVNEFNI